MSNENIQEIIIEHLTEGTKISEDILKQIKSSEELSSYFDEMTQILSSAKEEKSAEPSEEYWDDFYTDLDKKLPAKKTKILQFVRSSYVRNSIAACLLVAAGFFGGKISTDQKMDQQIVQIKHTSQKLKSLLHRSTVVLTSFTTMSEIEAFDVLPVNIRVSQSLLDDTKNIRSEYKNDQSIDELLSELERILTAISSTKGTSPNHIKMVQYGVERRNVISKIRQIQI